ncbi:MAG TPA: hypothetical protein PLB56_04810 [Spirochaetales bacterium]|nr:hypothetical protein [Spirochaetales bacterium]
MKRILNIAAAVLLAAAVLVSCEPGPAGLFALLEEEEPLDKGTAAFNANTAAFVTRVNGAPDYYYAAVGATLLRRDVAGTTWETVSVPGAPAGSIISSGVSFGTDLYISYAPAADTIFHFDGTTWDATYDNLSTGDPVQSLLMASNGQMFAVTQASTGTSSSDYSTEYSIFYDTAGTFASSGAAVTDVASGRPNSVATDGSDYWIVAGNKVFTGVENSLAEDAIPADISATKPAFGAFYDGVRVLISGTGYLFNASAAYAKSGTFGSAERRLSSVIVVPKNGGGNATLVGVKSWASDEYTGYYEYDAALNAGLFSSVVPSTAYDMVSDNSNYVTTLDDLSIEGFYFDSVGQVLFARTVKGGLWSNTYSGGVWSGWDRE